MNFIRYFKCEDLPKNISNRKDDESNFCENHQITHTYNDESCEFLIHFYFRKFRRFQNMCF